MTTKKPFNPVYKQYDTSKGFGSPSDWRSAFKKRMGFDEAVEVLKGNDPYSILGILQSAVWNEIKKAYRSKAMENHPDKHPDEQEKYTALMQQITAAYTVLEKKFGK